MNLQMWLKALDSIFLLENSPHNCPGRYLVEGREKLTDAMIKMGEKNVESPHSVESTIFPLFYKHCPVQWFVNHAFANVSGSLPSMTTSCPWKMTSKPQRITDRYPGPRCICVHLHVIVVIYNLGPPHIFILFILFINYFKL